MSPGLSPIAWGVLLGPTPQALAERGGQSPCRDVQKGLACGAIRRPRVRMDGGGRKRLAQVSWAGGWGGPMCCWNWVLVWFGLEWLDTITMRAATFIPDKRAPEHRGGA